MFKGINKDFIQALERYNQDPSNHYFFFCASDLQPSPNRQLGELKFDIHSSELRQKLGNLIIAEGGTMSNPSVIKFTEVPKRFIKTEEKWWEQRWNWIRLNKEFFIQMVNANSEGRIIEFSKEPSSRTYVWNSKNHYTTNEPWKGVSVGDVVWEVKYRANMDLSSTTGLKDEEDIYSSTKKVKEYSSTTLTEIKNELSKTGLNEKDLRVEFINLLPDWCECEINIHSENEKLWEEHLKNCLWREESEVDDFKNEMLQIINSNFSEYKKQVIEETIKQVDKDKLKNKEPNWEDKLQSLQSKKEVLDYQNALKEMLNENTSQTNINQGENNNSGTNDNNNKEKPSPNHNSNGSNDNSGNNKNTAQKVDDNLQKTSDPNATIQDKKEGLEELDKNEGDATYEENKEQVKEVKKEVARDNPQEYKEKVVKNLTKKLAENGLNKNDLDSQTQQEIKDLKNGGELEPEKLVEAEMKLTEKIRTAGAKKKVDKLNLEVETILKNPNKVQVGDLKKRLLEIINSSNIYYTPHKTHAEKLLKQLESISLITNNRNSSDNSLPLPIKIGIGIAIVLVLGFFVFLIWRKKRDKESRIEKTS